MAASEKGENGDMLGDGDGRGDGGKEWKGQDAEVE